MKKDKYFDLIYKIGDDVHLVLLTDEQIEKLNILVNLLGDIGDIKVSGQPFLRIKKTIKEDSSNV